MKRRIGWILTCLLFTSLALAAASPPNILFLFSDDQRHDTIHALGNGAIRTPHLDRLVESGLAFTHAHIMGAMQGAVCVPSRAMLLTGRSLFRCVAPLSGSAIPPSHTLLPEALRAAGYSTIGLGKWHNDRPAFARAFDQGGPIFFGGMSDHRRIALHDFDPSGRYTKPHQYIGAGWDTALFADAAIRFLRQARADQPFFLYAAFTSPHDPRTPPPEFAARCDAEKIPLPPNFLPEHPFDNGELTVRDERLLPWPRTPAAVRGEIALYYGMIEHLDAEIGRVLRALEETGLADKTLVVFAGDNGLAVGQHGLLGKQNLYDHSLRVPLILRGPGLPKGRKIDALCYLLDVYPTLCELAGAPTPEGLEGRSLVPVVRGEKRQVRDSLFAAYRHVQRMVRDERWKLISYPQAGRLQLFDLRDDPWERRDLSGDPAHAGRLAALQERLRVWQRETGDPLAAKPQPLTR